LRKEGMELRGEGKKRKEKKSRYGGSYEFGRPCLALSLSGRAFLLPLTQSAARTSRLISLPLVEAEKGEKKTGFVAPIRRRKRRNSELCRGSRRDDEPRVSSHCCPTLARSKLAFEFLSFFLTRIEVSRAPCLLF
jgi:hypothetical protein